MASENLELTGIVTRADGTRGRLEGTLTWTPHTTPPPPSGDVIGETDFDYLGAYRVPTEDGAIFQFAYGGIAGRKVNGRTRLFLTGNEVVYHAPVMEFEIPAASPSTEVATSPQMSRVRFWGDVYGGRRGTYMTAAGARSGLADLRAAGIRERDPDRLARILEFIDLLEAWLAGRTKSDDAWEWYEFPVGASGIGGLLWDDASSRLFWTYYDFYNVSGRPDWGLGASKLRDELPEGDPGAFVVDGPWRFACPVGGVPGERWTAYGPWRGNSLIIRPDTGELVVSGTMMSGNASSPWGPCAYGGGRLPVPGAPWNVDLVQPICYLDHYVMLGKIDEEGRLLPGEPLRSARRRTDVPPWESFGGGNSALNINPDLYGYGSWREVDGSGAMLWIDNLRGKSGLLFGANLCGINIPGITDPGHEWYATAANEWKCPNHRLPAPVSNTGPVSTGNFSALITYAIPDLLKVAAGELAPYAPEPAMCLNLQKKWQVVGASPLIAPNGNNSFGGTYFDKDERLLYTMCPKADYHTPPGVGAPFIHVFRVGGA